MTPETAKRLRDARDACAEVAAFVAGEDLDSFLKDRGLQLILQALFSNIGEAMNQARRTDPALSDTLTDLHRIIGMRNRIVHGYDSIDYEVMWYAATERVPRLAESLRQLLAAAPDTDRTPNQ